MRKNLALFLSGTAALLAFNAAQAAAPSGHETQDSLAANSYAELLEPVPDAREALIADDARLAQQPQATLQLAQYHHHHHHHHHGFGGFGVYVAPPYYAAAPDCYWTVHRYWNGRYWVHRRVRVCG